MVKGLAKRDAASAMTYGSSVLTRASAAGAERLLPNDRAILKEIPAAVQAGMPGEGGSSVLAEVAPYNSGSPKHRS